MKSSVDPDQKDRSNEDESRNQRKWGIVEKTSEELVLRKDQ